MLVLLLCAAGLGQSLAQTFTVGNLNYSLNDDGASVTVTGHVDGQNATGELVIPESVELYGTTYPVTVIGSNAFQYCSGLTGTLVIPNSVVTIGDEAFSACNSLTSLTLGNAVQNIGNSAFQICSGLTGSLVIPNSVVTIGAAAFDECPGFTSLALGNAVQSIYNSAFYSTGFTGTLTIPESVTYMGWGAFAYCNGFTSLTYNATNCSVDAYWLIGTTSMTTLNIGENVQVIPDYFLNGLTSFTGELVIPESVTSIGENAFSGCTGFTGSLNIGDAVTTIGANAFDGCSGFTGSLTIPNAVSSIGANAFSGCTSFSGTFTIGNSVSEIGNAAFFGACEGFTSFDVKPETPPALGTNVFTSIDNNIPMQVPCGSLNAYQNADGWNVFTNIQEPDPCMWEITATANPAEGGTVSGGGTYEQGTTCTLMATPAEGYEFVNWKENNAVVSEEATYSFTVEGNRTLTAQFRLPPDPVGTVVAEYYPDPENSESPYVKLHWNGGIEGEGFETGDFSMQEWQLDPTYPWQINSNTPYEGSYCMRSGGSGVHGVTSNMTLTVDFTADGTLSFFSRTSSEGGCDYGRFYIDGQEMGNWSGETGWEEHTYTITAGSHTFQWGYTKDGSVNAGDDCFLVDNIIFDWGEGPHYRVYRSGCDNGSFNLLADNVTGVSYTDNSWLQLAVGSYQYGVCAVYNDGTTSSIRVSDCIEKHANITVAITAVPNYEERGTVSGAGDYLQGETCSLTATANEGFEFRNWTEDGQVVSTEAQYSFTVLTARNLTANFSTPAIVFADENVKAICVNNWDTDGDGEITYDEAAAVTDIGDVFRDHNEITSFNELQYFTGITTIGYYAFMNCTNLTSVVIPEGVTRLDYMAFAYSGLTEITIPESINWTSNVVFEGCEALTVMNYNAINCTRVAEYYYSWLTGCNSLTTLNIGENVQSIPWGAFRGCSNLTGVLTIPESVTSIASDAFANTSFTTINYNATNCTYNDTYYYGPFHDCYTPATLHIGENVQTIPQELFSGHTGLTGELALPSMLTSIGENAFAGCSGLTGSLVIPSSVVSIGAGAFSGCSGFTGELVVPASIATIEGSVFQDCSGFTGSLLIPDYITYVGGYAFYGCTGLGGELTIGSAVEFIGEYAFDNTGFSTLNFNAVNCQELGYYYPWAEDWRPAFHNFPLTTLHFGEGVESIPFRAFRDLTTLTGPLTLPNSLTTIGDQAFYNCYGFESIVMGNSVETIGSEAFRNCGGMRGELTLPETLQTVGNYAFASCDELTTINYNAINCTEMGNAQQPVFYDCASLKHINIGENVQSIPNYAFKRCSTVTDMTVAAQVPPTIFTSTFGTVSRSIPVSVPYGTGDTYRNAPYWEEFFNITEDYSPSQYTCHWTVDTHQFADNMTAIGVIQIDGVEQMTDALEIGAFCGSECRGRQLLAYYPDFDRYLVFLTIYGEDGDALSFRLYDHEASAEIDMGCTTHLNFLTDDIIGTLTEPHPFNFVAMQEAQFAAGWNWWSAYVELGDDGLALLQDGLGTSGMMVKSQNDGYASYLEGFGWYGSLSAIDNENTYQIRASEACAVGIAGTTANPADHPITLSSGWNWVGYPVSASMSITEALSGIEPQSTDMLKSQNDGFASYLEGYGWYGSLNTLNPGMGLMYKSNNASTVTLVYPCNGTRTDLKANQTTEINHWQPNLNAYADNMSVMAVIELDGEELASENFELAAFANGTVRGSARLLYVEPLNRYMAFLTVAGEEAAELHFGLYNTKTGAVETCHGASLQYETNAVVGSFADPYVVSFRSTTGVDEWAGNLQVYPNPVEHGQTVSLGFADAETGEVRVEIVNAHGMVVETILAPSVQTIVAPNVAGVYMLRVTVEGKGTCYRKLVVR